MRFLGRAVVVAAAAALTAAGGQSANPATGPPLLDFSALLQRNRIHSFIHPSVQSRQLLLLRIAPCTPPLLRPHNTPPCLSGSIIVTWISGKYLGSHHVLSAARDSGKLLARAARAAAQLSALGPPVTNTLQILAELCTYLVEDVYGELAAVCPSIPMRMRCNSHNAICALCSAALEPHMGDSLTDSSTSASSLSSRATAARPSPPLRAPRT